MATDNTLAPASTPSLRRSTQTRSAPERFKPFHLYTTIAKETPASHQYVDATRKQVDLSLPDHQVATICHDHMFVHAAEQRATTSPTQGKQFGLKKGLRTFGTRGASTLLQEMTQFHMLNCFTPLDASKLTRYDKRQALISLMFLTKKSSGEIKAHGCADGRKQREHIAKDEATAPTVSTDALFITLVISAHEQHNVASADIPGAFLHADNDERVTMRLDGILAEIMVKIAPSLYRPFITATHLENLSFTLTLKRHYMVN